MFHEKLINSGRRIRFSILVVMILIQAIQFIGRRRQCEEHLRAKLMRVCASPTSSACREAVTLPIWPAITAWRRRSARTPSQIAPAATACTTFCRPAIRNRPSTMPTWPRPAASAILEQMTSSSPARCTWTVRPRPTLAASSSA